MRFQPQRQGPQEETDRNNAMVHDVANDAAKKSRKHKQNKLDVRRLFCNEQLGLNST